MRRSRVARLVARYAATVALAVAAVVRSAAAGRPQPSWKYSYDSFPAAWFGANSTGWETESQLEQLGRYHLVAFGFFDLLTKNNYTHEGAALIEQSRIVKQRHPNVTVGIYIDNLRFEPFYHGMEEAIADPRWHVLAQQELTDARATRVRDVLCANGAEDCLARPALPGAVLELVQ